MLFLPKKPKIRIETAGDNQYLVTFLGRITDEQEFNDMLYDHLQQALGVNDSFKDLDWRSQSVVVSTDDIEAFERRIVFFEITTGITIQPGSS